MVANDLFVSALTGHVAAMASEEEETAIAGAANRKYEIAFDPLDGSSNLDTNLPTGSIFCVFEHTPGSRVKAPPWQCLSSASYAFPGCAWWLWSVRHSQSEARPLGAQPLPRLLEPTASTADGFTAFDDPGQATPSKAAAARRSSPPATRSTGKLLVSSPSSRNCAAGETWRVVPFFLVNTYPSTAHLPLYSAPTPLQRTCPSTARLLSSCSHSAAVLSRWASLSTRRAGTSSSLAPPSSARRAGRTHRMLRVRPWWHRGSPAWPPGAGSLGS